MGEVPIQVMPWHRPDPCKPSKMQTRAAFKPSYMDHLASLELESPPLAVPLTHIMCTIGPSSSKVDMMLDLMHQGMSMALVPLALGTRRLHTDTVANLRRANTSYNTDKNRSFPLAIAVQTKGPGLRIGGLVKDVPVELALRQRVTVCADKNWRSRGNEHRLYLGLPELQHVLSRGDVLLLGDGRVILRVEAIENSDVVCKVMGAGVIHSFMPVTLPDIPVSLPPLTDEDEDDLRAAAALGVDLVVATRTQTSGHIRQIRKILAEEENGSGIKVWAQIETKKGLDNLEAIIEEADVVLLSRVGLTHDLPAEKLFLAQKIVIATCNKAGVPVFVSSHYLPSMQAEVAPSIPEMSDVAAAILDGADGFVTRNTTAIGRHPEQAVRTLAALCREAEAAVWHSQTFKYLNTQTPPPIDPANAICISAVQAALNASASAILVTTTSGLSAQVVARYRPRCPVIAVTRYAQVARHLHTWRAVIPLHYVEPPLSDWTREVEVRLQYAMELGKELGVISPGDAVVVVNGWRQGAGFTNTIRVVYASQAFPWVYPHRLPAQVEEPPPPGPSLQTLAPDNIATLVFDSKTSPLATSGDDKADEYSIIAETRITSMEEEFDRISSTKAKEFEADTLSSRLDHFRTSKSDSGTKALSANDMPSE